MGYIPSADTIYVTAYLTDIGRTYLFNKNNTRFDSNGDDLFEIKKFTLSDADTNYKTGLPLISGDIPDVTGKSDGCLKTASNFTQTNLVAFFYDGSPINIEYTTGLPVVGVTPSLLITEGSMPTSAETPPPLPAQPGSLDPTGSAPTTF